jgi:hypothetical protein
MTPAASGPPKRPLLIWTIPLLFPAGMLIAGMLGRTLPSIPGPLIALIAIGLPMLLVVVLAVRDRRTKREQARLVPTNAGFSAKVDLLANRFEERAAALEQAVTFGNEIPPAEELEDFWRELRRTEENLGHRGPLEHLSVSMDEERLLTPDVDADFRNRIREHAARLRSAAKELRIAANEIRQQGGVFRLSTKERTGCGAIVLVMIAGGGYLAWHSYRASDTAFWWGAGTVVLGLCFAYALIGSQLDPA